MSAPASLLTMIKQDMNICTVDDDAKLQRALNGIWSRMEHYTARVLACPPASFIDDWGLISFNGSPMPMPPALWRPQRTSAFLRYFPVVSIDAVENDGAIIDPTAVQFDARTGKLFGIGTVWAEELWPQLYNSHARVTYKAGWTEIPGDLYEIVLGAIQQLWPARSGQGGGLGGTVNSINVIDVGSVELGQGSAFVQSASKSAAGADPLLGPYLSMLDLYVDHRNLMGWQGQPTTTASP